jgi:hypothetical protein
MAGTQIRSNTQIIDSSISLPKMAPNFVQNATWVLSSDNSAIITGVSTPVAANDVVNKQYVDGLINTSMKSPDGFITDALGNYPSDYKGTAVVTSGDSFYITSTTNGTSVGTKKVNVGDMLVAVIDAPGNIDSNWLIIESNRNYATDVSAGLIELGTQSEIDSGIDTTRAVTSATLNGYINNKSIIKKAGAGMVEDNLANFNVAAIDSSILVYPDTIGVGVGNSNGTSVEITATGLELAPSITGNRTFSGGLFSVSTGTSLLTLSSTNSINIDAPSDKILLSSQPTGSNPLAVSTTLYVDNSIAALPTKVFNELPLVTAASANVTIINTPISGTLRVYLNGIRQAPGAGNDYTLTGNTVVFTTTLNSTDVVVLDYEY